VPTDDPYANLETRARDGRARVLPRSPASAAAPGSALESLERIAFGDVWQRPGLTVRERRLVTLACLGLNGSERTLELHLRGALDSGDLDHDDLDAFVLHFGIYAGFPRASFVASAIAAIRADPDGAAPPRAG
jgi:4-carboxymuconolactone decarboxylase